MGYTVETRAIAGQTNVDTLYKSEVHMEIITKMSNDAMSNDFFFSKNAPHAKG